MDSNSNTSSRSVKIVFENATLDVITKEDACAEQPISFAGCKREAGRRSPE
jgi:hypothetical protein